MTEQVICMNDSLPQCGYWHGDPVVRGRFYTIRGDASIPSCLGILLNEVRSQSKHKDGRERGYRTNRFQPINDDAIEIFRKMARKAPKREGANA